MRKFTTLLLSFVLIASYAISQQQMDYNYSVSTAKLEKAIKQSNTKEDPTVHWSVNFEEEDPVWTFGKDVGETSWKVIDSTGLNPAWGSAVTNKWYFQPLGRYSETGNAVDGHWALIDIIGEFSAPPFNGTGQGLRNSWIQFDNIDLSEVEYPKLVFYQLYRPLNQVASYIDLSTDGGTTWTEIQVNKDIKSNDYGPITLELYIGSHVANKSNVSIRFRWKTSGTGLVGYGWQIDDIKITDNQDYDLNLYDTRINFFEYVDYTQPGDESRYHYSSHFGQIPVLQYTSAGAVCWFNAAVENKGVYDAKPTISVKVTNPNDEIVFDEEIIGKTLAVAEKDTLDMLEVDFVLGENPAIGKYTIAYSVRNDGNEGIEDENISDNVDTAFFYVTEGTYSRDANEITGQVGASSWLDHGHDGDMVATDMLYLFQGEQITSVDIFIAEESNAGASFMLKVLHVDNDEWSEYASSSLITLGEEDLGNWMHIQFADLVSLEYDEGYESKSLRVAVEFYYNGTDAVFIGTDISNPHSIWGTIWKFIGDNWTAITGFEEGLAIRLNTTYENSVSLDNLTNLSIYPNPTTGILNIEGIVGANVQILNIMGQVVKTIENTNEFNAIDMSKYSNGTYFVKVIVDNNVTTRKINLIK